jgi:hypothetical protein
MKAFTAKIASPAHARWLDAIVLELKDFTFTRRELDALGVGLHTIGAARLSRAIGNGYRLADIYAMGLAGFLRFPGVGEVSAIIMAHCLIEKNYDALKWIDSKGRTIRGAIANAKAKPKARIPGRKSGRKD